jgi:hypothetical protein
VVVAQAPPPPTPAHGKPANNPSNSTILVWLAVFHRQ